MYDLDVCKQGTVCQKVKGKRLEKRDSAKMKVSLSWYEKYKIIKKWM